MKRSLHIIFFVLLLSGIKLHAQDKLILKNSNQVICKIVAISENTISYRDTLPDAQLLTIPKTDVLIAEYKNGGIYIFGAEKIEKKEELSVLQSNETREQRKERKLQEWKKQEANLSDNILGFYIPELILGRFTVSYERLFAGKSMGIVIPLSLTYNPFNALDRMATSSSTSSTSSTSTSSSSSNSNNNNNSSSSSSNTTNQPRGVSFIGGIDINYYYDLKPELKYYFGPRIRYGTDMMLGGLEGLTVQLQNGIFRSRGEKFTSTLGVGVGFFKLSQKYAQYPGYDSKQVYPWGSITWRLGFRL